jgi:hypothetical protein
MNFAYETYPSNERMNTLMNHELVHIVNFDRPAGADRFWRTLFAGKVSETDEHPETIVYAYLTAPRTAAPRWYHEGIAVFTETWMAGGLGRAQGCFDEMVFRAMVADGRRFYDPLGLVAEGVQTDFQVELLSYLYGTRFLSWLAWEYSPAKALEWYTRTEGSAAYYAHRFRQVFGISLEEAWNRWVEFEHGFQEANLARLRAYPITPHRDLSPRALGAISRPWYDAAANRIYLGLNYPGKVAHLGAIDLATGEVEELTEIKGPLMYSVTSLAFDPRRQCLYYTTDNSAWRDIVRYDLATGDRRTLMKDVRVGDLVVDPTDGALWGIRHLNGLCTLVRIEDPYDEWDQIHTWDFGQTVYGLDLSPDGRLLSCAVGEADGSHFARIFAVDSLRVGTAEPVAEFSFPGTLPADFVFSPDGDALYGTCYYTGVSNVWRYDVAADTLACLTNTDTGFFRPIPTAGDSLIVFRFSGGGFVPTAVEAAPLEDANAITLLGTEIARKHPEIKEWKAGSPKAVPLDSMVVRRGRYRPLGSLELESMVPIVEGYKEYGAVGLLARLSDPLSMHRISLEATWTPDARLDADERLHAALSWRRYDWRLSAGWNDADFYDLFGPTKTSLKGWYTGLGYTKTLLYDQPRQMDLNADATFYGDLERVPDYQNVAANYTELLTARVALSYKNLRFSLGAVDYEKGITWSVAALGNRVRGDVFGQLRGHLDLGVPLFAHSSIWLRSAGGWSPGPRDEPFANFFLGAFGNNWVDHLEVKRYREWYAFPGIEINEVGGTNFTRVMLDWNLPPLRFRRAGKPAFHASWMRMSLFTSGLLTNLDLAGERSELVNAGAQLDMRLRLLSHLDLTLSVGWASAWRDADRRGDEFMVSLKLP